MNDFLYPTFPINEELFRKDGNVDWDLDEDDLREYVKQELAEIRTSDVWRFVFAQFKQDDMPMEMSPAELVIFKVISKRMFRRVQIVSSTQYGKTLTVADGLLSRIANFPEDWLAVEPDMKRGKILLNYIIKATSENDYFKRKLIGVKMEDRTALNRLLEERSKVKLTYQILADDDSLKYGSIEVISAEAKRKNDVMSAVMGFGGRNVVSDESSLLDDEIESAIFRMLAGKGEDTFYLKIGNPFYRKKPISHFFKSWKSPLYKKVFVDYRIGLADGRYTHEFIEEARTKPKFDVLYQAHFPSEEGFDAGGFLPLLSELDLQRALVDDIPLVGEQRLMGDIAGGGRNYSTIILKGENAAKLLYKEHTPDTMQFISLFADYREKLKVLPENCFLDEVGIGKGVVDRGRELIKGNTATLGVNVGNTPEPETGDKHLQYMNLRAQAFWRAKTAIEGGFKLVKNPKYPKAWEELLDVKYKIQSDKKIKIKSKEEMGDDGIESPDVADGLMLGFVRSRKILPQTPGARTQRSKFVSTNPYQSSG